MTELATTPRLRALGHDFDVTAHAPLAHHIESVFSAIATDGEARHHYELIRSEEPGQRWTLTMDGISLMESGAAGFIYSYLCWHINRTAIEDCDDRLLLHCASACDERGQAVLLPAVMESGKTTTVAALVHDGLSYVTDEATAIDLHGGPLTGFCKPLSVDKGSWKELAELRPVVEADVEPHMGSQWQVPASSFGTVALQAQPAIVVSPAYTKGAGVDLEPLSPGETLVLLGQNAFNLSTFGRSGFAALETIARSCPGYRLRYDDTPGAVDAVRGLLEKTTP